MFLSGTGRPGRGARVRTPLRVWVGVGGGCKANMWDGRTGVDVSFLEIVDGSFVHTLPSIATYRSNSSTFIGRIELSD